MGPIILDRIMLDIFGTLYHMTTFLKDNSNKDTGPTRQELIKTANLLFAQLETSYVWICCREQLSQSCSLLAFVGEAMDVSIVVAVGGIGSGPPTISEI